VTIYSVYFTQSRFKSAFIFIRFWKEMLQRRITWGWLMWKR